MRRSSLILLGLLFVGSLFAGNNKVEVDPRLKPYVVEWCWRMEQAGIPWQSKFQDLVSIKVEPYSVDSREVGNSWRWTHTITINERFIDVSPCVIRSTIFHELGHAVFELDHECCTIMKTTTYTNYQIYCDQWDLFVKEYLVQCKKAAYE